MKKINGQYLLEKKLIAMHGQRYLDEIRTQMVRDSANLLIEEGDVVFQVEELNSEEVRLRMRYYVEKHDNVMRIKEILDLLKPQLGVGYHPFLDEIIEILSGEK